MIYVVKQNDTLYSIAQRYGVSLNNLIEVNQFTHPNDLVVGQTVFIPQEDIVYTVVQGDSLFTIANKYNVSLERLIAANANMNFPYIIRPGDKITIPLSLEKLGEMESNGFVFPTVSDSTLSEILPHLTFISPFSYEVREDGSISPLNDTNVVTQAREVGVAPLMTITNIQEGGGFSGDITNKIFTNEEAEDALITNIINTMEAKDYFGIVVDFEYLHPSDKDNYTNFLKKLTDALHPLNYVVMVALAPKISADQPGTLYEAHDYQAIGQIVDRAIIMTYEWGYLYGPPLAVAPINPVREVLDYAVSAIPHNKILMGVPNYGYDWTLPFVQGRPARVVTNVGAVDLAREVGSFIQYDEVPQAPYFTYFRNGNEHIVWFEDARSIDAKLRLVSEYGLAGVSYWELSNNFPQNWLVQDSLFDIVKV